MDGPYRVVSVANEDVVLDINNSHEHVSCDRVTRADNLFQEPTNPSDNTPAITSWEVANTPPVDIPNTWHLVFPHLHQGLTDLSVPGASTPHVVRGLERTLDLSNVAVTPSTDILQSTQAALSHEEGEMLTDSATYSRGVDSEGCGTASCAQARTLDTVTQDSVIVDVFRV